MRVVYELSVAREIHYRAKLCTYSFWRRNNNSECRGHDLHDPMKDCSIALDSYRTTQGKLYGGGYHDP